jgi:hypothetical protein
MPEIDKKRFAFPKVEYRVDLYLDGKKVVSNHRGETGNYYFRVECDCELTVAEHDPNIPVEYEIKDGKLSKIVRTPKFVKTESPDAKRRREAEEKAKQEAAAKAERAAALKARMDAMKEKPKTE